MANVVSNNKQIAKNLFFNGAVFVINLGISFFLTPFLVKAVGKEAYSFYPLVGNLIGYSSVVTTAVGSMAGRFVTMSLYKKKQEEAEEYFNSVIFAYWIISLFLSLFLVLLIVYVGSILTVPDSLLNTVRWMLGLSGVSMLVGLNVGPLALGTYIKNRVDLNAITSFFAVLVNLSVITFLFYFFKADVLFVSVAACVSTLVNVYFCVQYKKKLLPEFEYSPITKSRWEKIRTLVFSGVWNSVNQLSFLLLTQLDLFIANVFISAAVTGDYALVKVVPNLMYSLFAILAGTFTPNFNILYAQGKAQELKSEVLKAMKIVGFLFVIPLGFLMVFARDFFALWVPSQDADFLSTLSTITLVPLVISGAINPIFSVFSITNRLKIPSLVLLGAGILNTLLILLLLKTTNLGVWAIAIVGSVQLIVRHLLFTPIYAAKTLQLNSFAFYPAILKCVVALSVVVGISIFVRRSILVDSWWLFCIAGTCVTALSLIVNSVFMLSKSERSFLLKKIGKL